MKDIKVGDKVYFKKDWGEHERATVPFSVSEEMIRYHGGKWLTITRKEINFQGIPRYTVKEDNGRFAWSIPMFNDRRNEMGRVSIYNEVV